MWSHDRGSYFSSLYDYSIDVDFTLHTVLSIKGRGHVYLCPPCYLQLLAQCLAHNRYSVKTSRINEQILFSGIEEREDGRH